VQSNQMSEKNRAPVFVVGCPRSGTTLLYHMLISSGGFANYRTESNVFNLLAPKFGSFAVLRNRQRLMQTWLRSILFERSGLDARLIESKILSDCRSSGDFLRIVMEEICHVQGVDRWADCTPDHILYLSDIKKSIPNALVIHIIRDGRDVALSFARQGWARPLPWDRNLEIMVAGLYWEWAVRRGRAEGAKLGADYTEVRFEDLVRRPPELLANLGTFIGKHLDYDFIRRNAIGSVRNPNTSFGHEVESGEFNPIERWHSGYSAEHLRMFESLVGGLLAELGYPLNMSRELSPQNGVRRMRFTYRLLLDFKCWARSRTALGRLIDCSMIFSAPNPIGVGIRAPDSQGTSGIEARGISREL